MIQEIFRKTVRKTIRKNPKKNEKNDDQINQDISEISFTSQKYKMSVYPHLFTVWTGSN